MIKNKSIVCVVLGLTISLSVASIALAAQPLAIHREVAPSNGHATVNIPPNTVEVSPDVFNIGIQVDTDGTVL